jgi:hypothetical protein
MNFNKYINLFWTQRQMKCTWVRDVRLPEEALNYQNRQSERTESRYLKWLTLNIWWWRSSLQYVCKANLWNHWYNSKLFTCGTLNFIDQSFPSAIIFYTWLELYICARLMQDMMTYWHKQHSLLRVRLSPILVSPSLSQSFQIPKTLSTFS